MKTNLIKQLSTLTTIHESTLSDLFGMIEKIICDDVLDMILNEEKTVDIDVSIGTLTIFYDSSDLKFKFTPNAKFRDDIVNTIKTKNSPIKIDAENTLKERLSKIYKDLL